MNAPIFMLTLLAALALGGCQPSPPKLAGSGMEMFTPVKMRLHPLSRIASASLVEARLEFTDQFGDVSKGVGAVAFDLFTYSAILPSHKGDRINHWEMDISTPAENRARWDSITRTYLFSLPLAPGSVPATSRYVLSAALMLPNGQRFSDDLTLAVK